MFTSFLRSFPIFEVNNEFVEWAQRRDAVGINFLQLKEVQLLPFPPAIILVKI